MNHGNVIKTIGIVVIAVILLGEVFVYTSSTDSYNINASMSGDNVNYSIFISGSQSYETVLMESSMRPTDEVYIYYDENYASACSSETGPVGSVPVDLGRYLDQLTKNLEYRGGPPVKVLNASELAEAMASDSAGTTKSLVVFSGALPDTIYQGNADDLIFTWLNDGGRLYWAGNLLGKYISSPGGVMLAGDNYQELFFGAECLNTGDDSFVSHDVSDNDLRYDLSLKNNRIKFGVDISEIPSDRGRLAIGYSENNYSSIVFTQYGGGMICVLAGDLSRNQWSDLSQVLAAGISYSTTVIDTADGSLKYGGTSGTFDITGYSGDITLYVYLGGYYPVCGRLFSLPAE